MKKIFTILMIFALTSCTIQDETTYTPSIETENTKSEKVIEENSSTLAFKQEYESLNDDNHLFVEVPTDIVVENMNFAATKDMLENGTGILYFGFPTCPWCRTLLPEMFDSMKQNNIKNLYYYNPKEIRNKFSRDENGELIEEIATNEEYAYLLNKLDSVLPVYTNIDTDGSIKRLYVPFIVVLKDGKILDSHLSTLEEQMDVKVPLTDKQKAKLQNLLSEKFAPLKPASLFSEPCDSQKENHTEPC